MRYTAFYMESGIANKGLIFDVDTKFYVCYTCYMLIEIKTGIYVSFKYDNQVIFYLGNPADSKYERGYDGYDKIIGTWNPVNKTVAVYFKVGGIEYETIENIPTFLDAIPFMV
jgi:hypothetical protein